MPFMGDEPVVEQRGMVNAVGVGDQRVADPGQVKQPVPGRIVPCQPGDLQRQHDANLVERDLGDQALEGVSLPGHRTRRRPGRRRRPGSPPAASPAGGPGSPGHTGGRSTRSVVYGPPTPESARDERLATRFDYDAVFGTVLNRFVIQAVIGHPLTVYGTGGQTRGMIDIRDTVRCVQLACENPADRGEFRVFNQITEWMSVKQIAETIKAASPEDVHIDYLPNPRVELADHYYNVTHTKLIELGLQPHLLSDTLIESLFEVTKRYAHRVRPEALLPTVKWRTPTA